MAHWDLTALVNAADPKAPLAERHLWLVRLMEWVRHAPVSAAGRDEAKTPLPIIRLRLLLAQLDGHPAIRQRVQALLECFWREVHAAALFADFGFGPRMSLTSEFMRRVGLKLLPATPETRKPGGAVHPAVHARRPGLDRAPWTKPRWNAWRR